MLRTACLLVLSLAACSPQPEPNVETKRASASSFPAITDWSSLKISLSRGICLGTCPSYDVVISGDGSVEYCGMEYVHELGSRTRRIPSYLVWSLVQFFREADFLELRDYYLGPVTDGPTKFVSISFDGREKSVGDNAGKFGDMPADVTRIQDAIDLFAGTSEWVGDGSKVDQGPEPECLKAKLKAIDDHFLSQD